MNKFRYIDKRILCSYDLSEEFFYKLGVKVYDIIPLRKVFILFTDKGKKILKIISSSQDRIKFIDKALNIIKENDSYIILQYCTNSKWRYNYRVEREVICIIRYDRGTEKQPLQIQLK